VRAPRGLTLIEVLIAILIFTVLMTVVSQSLLPLFGFTRSARSRLDANQRAQQVIEAIRAAWVDADRYRKTCAPIALPPGVSVAVQALDHQARPDRGRVLTELTLDIRGP